MTHVPNHQPEQVVAMTLLWCSGCWSQQMYRMNFHMNSCPQGAALGSRSSSELLPNGGLLVMAPSNIIIYNNLRIQVAVLLAWRWNLLVLDRIRQRPWHVHAFGWCPELHNLFCPVPLLWMSLLTFIRTNMALRFVCLCLTYNIMSHPILVQLNYYVISNMYVRT